MLQSNLEERLKEHKDLTRKEALKTSCLFSKVSWAELTFAGSSVTSLLKVTLDGTVSNMRPSKVLHCDIKVLELARLLYHRQPLHRELDRIVCKPFHRAIAVT
jgi:hypothetical protein